MNGASTMTMFTEEAEVRLHQYLDDVRAAANGLIDVDPDEVVGDVREHVEMAFHNAEVPITLLTLEKVLAQLGPPNGWTRDSEKKSTLRQLWERVVAAVVWVRLWGERHYEKTMRSDNAVFAKLSQVLRFGPDEYRLSYLAFGLFTIGVIVWPLLIPAYFLGRAALSLSAGRELGGRKWLVYPPIVLISVPLLLVTLIGPILAGAALADLAVGKAIMAHRHGNEDKLEFVMGLQYIEAIPGQMGLKMIIAALFGALTAFGVWYTTLGIVGSKFPRTLEMVFVPFLNNIEQSTYKTMTFVGAIALMISAILGFRYLQSSGLI